MEIQSITQKPGGEQPDILVLRRLHTGTEQWMCKPDDITLPAADADHSRSTGYKCKRGSSRATRKLSAARRKSTTGMPKRDAHILHDNLAFLTDTTGEHGFRFVRACQTKQSTAIRADALTLGKLALYHKGSDKWDVHGITDGTNPNMAYMFYSGDKTDLGKGNVAEMSAGVTDSSCLEAYERIKRVVETATGAGELAHHIRTGAVILATAGFLYENVSQKERRIDPGPTARERRVDPDRQTTTNSSGTTAKYRGFMQPMDVLEQETSGNPHVHWPKTGIVAPTAVTRGLAHVDNDDDLDSGFLNIVVTLTEHGKYTEFLPLKGWKHGDEGTDEWEENVDTADLLGGLPATAGDYTAFSSMRPHCQAAPHPGVVTVKLFLTYRHISVQFDARQDTPRHMDFGRFCRPRSGGSRTKKTRKK